jgi:RNA polymerase sigma-B factor
VTIAETQASRRAPPLLAAIPRSRSRRIARRDSPTSLRRSARAIALFQEAAISDVDTARRLQGEVVLLYAGAAASIAARYRGRGVAVEDLTQAALLGLIGASRRFDPDRNTSFLSFAVPSMLGEVKRYFRDCAWTVRPPRRVQELQPQIAAALDELTQNNAGATPTIREIADRVGASERDVIESLTVRGCYAPVSLDRPASSAESDATATLAGTLGQSEPGYARAEAAVALRPLLRGLSERERHLIHRRFIDEWTQRQIAEELGVTQMHVSRLVDKILKRLRADLEATAPTDDGPPIAPDSTATRQVPIDAVDCPREAHPSDVSAEVVSLTPSCAATSALGIVQTASTASALRRICSPLTASD